MWSLVTETKQGMDNRTEALPMTIDPQYTVGFSWARQYGLRVAKNFNNKVWLAASLENSQETVTTHGNASNFLVGSPGAGGGLYNSARHCLLHFHQQHDRCGHNHLFAQPPTILSILRLTLSSKRHSSPDSDTTRSSVYSAASATVSFPAKTYPRPHCAETV